MKLEAEDVEFRYGSGGPPVLKNFRISLESGELVGITAPSGFGKTTCCKVLAGYEKPQKGKVLLDGRPLWEYRGRCPVQMVWQHPEEAVNPRLRMRETLREGKAMDRWLTDSLGIRDEWMERFPAELSGGELQRFCLARALGDGARFLLADEISAMLDLITQSEIWHFLMKEAVRRDIGILVVSHSPELLSRVCGRVVELKTEQEDAK